MIKKLILKNFKLFKTETSIPLSNLNLLTGINGRGKSTVLQSILLMKQSPEFDRTTSKLFFNGEDVKLGSFKDVKNVSTQSSENIELSFQYDKFIIKYLLNQNTNDLMVADINEIDVKGLIEGADVDFKLIKNGDFYDVRKLFQNENGSFTTNLYDLFINDITLAQHSENWDCEAVKSTINFSKVHYVSADRVGPKLFYKEKSLKEFPTVGALGEDTVNVLYHSKETPVDAAFVDNISRLFHVATEDLGRTVDLQAQFWLSKIFDGAKYEIKPVEEANLLTFGISPDGTFNYYKPTNTGYGFSYVLPIIIEGLIAKPGEILIVENPEAHLHPHAQSILAKFLTLVSLKNVQVIIESHSEHILNGLRIPVYDNVIPKEHLNVLYFDRNLENYFLQIDIGDKGKISNWPPDFFDQSTKDLNYLFGI